MRQACATSGTRTLRIDDLFAPWAPGTFEVVHASPLFSRSRASLPDGSQLLLDEFPGAHRARCLFLNLAPADAAVITFEVSGAHRIVSCEAGGWLIESLDDTSTSYWIPRLPVFRTFDAQQRILAEEPATITGFSASDSKLEVSFHAPAGLHLTWPVWHVPTTARAMFGELSRRLSVERMRAYLWSSQSSVGSPADLYLHLVDGRVYQNARAWPRKWKFCCDLDAFEIFVWLTGLERATGKAIYGLLRKQVLLSVLLRQSADGGWYHGEWTNQNESHYRFHTGALLLLENALDEWDDDTVRGSLAKGAAFAASRADKTDLGLWFLHDSLEESASALDDMHRQTGAIVSNFGAWKPSRMLGNSPTNKLILNTHVDTTVALDRFARLSGDEEVAKKVDSARTATRSLLALRPAEPLYRLVYRAVRLTLLPAALGSKLPLPVRAFKRLVWMYLLPNLYRLKRLSPRIVMPGGYIDRHLAPLHFDAKYHAVNVMDLVRLWRRFPDEPLRSVIDGGIAFVMGDEQSTLRWWSEGKPRQFSIVVFGEALYHLCMLRPDPVYRKHLAEVLLLVDDLGLGLPPSVLGGNAEITPAARQRACPSPADPRLLAVNLCEVGRTEILVVNPSDEPVELAWEGTAPESISWTSSDDQTVTGQPEPPLIPRRGWLVGVG